MARYNRDDLKFKYNNPSTGLYKDQLNNEIEAKDDRANTEDIADSHLNFTTDFEKYIRQGATTGSSTTDYVVHLDSPSNVDLNTTLFVLTFEYESTGPVTLTINGRPALKVFSTVSTQATAGTIKQLSSYMLRKLTWLDGGAGGYIIIGGTGDGGGGVSDWTAGTYATAGVVVMHTLDYFVQFFRLTAATPFTSSDFESEYASGDWELISERGYGAITKIAHGFPLNLVLTVASGTWHECEADDVPVAIVRQVIDDDTFIVVFLGDLSKGWVGLTGGAMYYVQSDGTIGLAETQKPVMFALNGTTAVLLYGGNSGITDEQLDDALDLKRDATNEVSIYNGNYTVDVPENIQLENGGAVVLQGDNTGNLTIPDNTTLPIGIGKTFDARGYNTVTPGAGVTITGENGTLDIPPGYTAKLEKTGTNTWILHNGFDLNKKADATFTIGAHNGNYTLTTDDNTLLNKGTSLILQGNSTGDLTIPPNATVPVGVEKTFGVRGYSNLVAGAGVTITGTNGTLQISPGRTVIVEKTGTDTWLLHNGTSVVSAWSTTEAGLVIESTPLQAENIVTGANTGSPTGLSSLRGESEISMYYLLRKIFTLAWTWTIGPIISDATVNTAAVFNASKKLVSSAYAALSDFITGTDNIKPITVAGLHSYRNIYSAIPAAVSAGTLPINLGGLVEAVVEVATTISANCTVTITATNGRFTVIRFKVTGTVEFTMPSNVYFEQTDVSLGRWNSSTKKLTLTGTTDTKFEIVAEQMGSDWWCFSSKYV